MNDFPSDSKAPDPAAGGEAHSPPWPPFEPRTGAAPAGAHGMRAERGGVAGALRQPWAIASVILVLVLAWQWYANYTQLRELREELASRLRDSNTDSRDARLEARQAGEATREAQQKLAQLDARLTDSQNQQVALQAMYQELARNRDESVLAEVEQILTVGAQQLQLAGNVQAGLLALQAADAQLARADRPQFIPLRKTLARDIDRLKATPSLDLPGMAVKLDQMMADVDSLPLAAEARGGGAAADAGVRGTNATTGYWAQLGGEIWSELRSLIRIEDTNTADPALLAPNQVYFLRENLRLRLLGARLALLARDQATFRADLRDAAAWTARWYDTRSRPVQGLQAALGQFSSTTVQIEVPGIGDSLNAVRNYKIAREPLR